MIRSSIGRDSSRRRRLKFLLTTEKTSSMGLACGEYGGMNRGWIPWEFRSSMTALDLWNETLSMMTALVPFGMFGNRVSFMNCKKDTVLKLPS